MRFFDKIIFLTLLLSVSCKGITDDLNPSGENRSSSSVGAKVTASLSSLSLNNTNGDLINPISLMKSGQKKAIVFYFTMWCPVCNSHTDSLINIIPRYNQVDFYVIDYISSNYNESFRNQRDNGYGSSPFQVLVDNDLVLSRIVDGTMASTVVIRQDETILMNEDYKTGEKLKEVLDQL